MNRLVQASCAVASASAVQGLTETPSADVLQLNQQVGNGFCQVFAGWDFFDLKKLDAYGRDTVKGEPAQIMTEKGDLVYKLCQPDWAYKPAEGEADPSCTELGMADAYFVGPDGTCQYAFKDGAVFTGTEGDPTADGEIQYTGFTLEMTSSTACGDGNFVFTINAMCSEEAVGFSVIDQSDCNLCVDFEGPEACKLYTFEAGKQMNKLKPFMGGILILFGLAMTFMGAKLLFQIFGGLVFLLTTSVLFMVIYNFFLPVTASIYVVGGVALVACVCGVFAAIFTYKFAKEWSVSLLAAWGGIVLAVIIANIANLNNATATIALAVVCAIAAGYVGKKMNKLVRTAGTAFVGAGLVMKGVSLYIIKGNGYGQLKQDNPIVWGLVGGLIFLSVAGTLVQLYIFRDENKEDDDFMAQEDEGRKCGCF